MKKTFQLSEVDCGVCAAKIETAVRKLDGVTNATVNFVTQKLTLEADDAAFDDVLARVKVAVPKAERGCKVL
ncbi:MAG TPA: cation transporter [Candidatus Limiplasma sp.]|nr:cation transporter [Candidatus Limiplasma sp.]HPS82231.1 cation transporter [Candidatus Limiplasma sp.]